MKFNDKTLTLLTGAFLAVAGGTATLFLGDHGEQDPVTTAALAPQAVPPVVREAVVVSAKSGSKDQQTSGVAIADPETEEMVFAAVEPDTTLPAGPDLVGIDAVVTAPELAQITGVVDITLTRSVEVSAPPDVPRVAAAQPETGTGLRAVSLPLVAELDCALDVRATRLVGARVRLSLVAPCHPEVEVTIQHADLRFKEKLDSRGRLSLKVPVFERFSRFDIQLRDGTRTTVGAYIADLSMVERVGISFTGADDIFLHAHEGDGRHIWRVEPRDAAVAGAFGGGYMTTLGDPTLAEAELVQIYTLPRISNAGTKVRFEVEIARASCDRSVELSLSSHGGKRGTLSKRIATHRAGCSGDDSLMLKNVVKDITLAAR